MIDGEAQGASEASMPGTQTSAATSRDARVVRCEHRMACIWGLWVSVHGILVLKVGS